MLLGCALFIGCDHGGDLAVGRIRLQEVLGGLPEGLKVLAYEPANSPPVPEEVSDTPATACEACGVWVVIATESLPVGADAVTGPAPATAPFAVAAAMAVDERLVGRPIESSGTISEWTMPDVTVRVRSAGADHGTLSVIETFPR